MSSPFKAIERTPEMTARAKALGEDIMSSKPQPRPNNLPPVKHTPEIEAAFGDSANDSLDALVPPTGDVIDFGNGDKVVLPPATPEPLAWYRKSGDLGRFWSNVSGCQAHYAFAGNREALVHEVVGSLHDLPADSNQSEVYAKVQESIRERTRKRIDTMLRNVGLPANAAGFKTATGYTNLETAIDGMGIHDVFKSIENYVKPTPVVTAPPETNEQKEQTPMTNYEPQSATNELTAPTHGESPVICYPDERGVVVRKGVRYIVTIREGGTAEQALHLLAEWDKFWKLGAEFGVMHKNDVPPIVMQPPVQSQGLPETYQQQPAQQNGGVAECVLITVGTSFSGGKPQLQFTCKGMDKPLAFTQPIEKMVTLLANVRQSNGQPFHVGLMAVGNMFPGTWKVNWQRSQPNSEGKSYNNIVSVSPVGGNS